MKFWTLILLGVMSEAVGDTMFRISALEKKSWILWVGYAIYIVGSFLWALALKYHELSKSIVIFGVLNVGICLLTGLWLGEQISWKQWIGIVLGIMSIIFVEMK